MFTKPGVKWFEIGNGTDGEFEFEIQAPDFVRLPDFAGRALRKHIPKLTAPGTAFLSSGEGQKQKKGFWYRWMMLRRTGREAFL